MSATVLDQQIRVEIPKGQVLKDLSISDLRMQKPSETERKPEFRQFPIIRTLHAVIAGIGPSKANETPEKVAFSEEPLNPVDYKAEIAKPNMTMSDLFRIVGKDSAARLRVKPAHFDSLVTAAEQVSSVPGDDPKAE